MVRTLAAALVAGALPSLARIAVSAVLTAILSLAVLVWIGTPAPERLATLMGSDPLGCIRNVALSALPVAVGSVVRSFDLHGDRYPLHGGLLHGGHGRRGGPRRPARTTAAALVSVAALTIGGPSPDVL